MKVRMLKLMAGPDGIHFPGQVVDFPDGEAQDLIRGDYAEEVIPSDVERRKDEPSEEDDAGSEEDDAGSEESEPVRETAAVEPPEKAIAPKKTVKKRRKSGG